MTRALVVVLSALWMVSRVSPPAGAAPVRVAYMYCDWPDGNAGFKDEFDQAFAALGWQVTKFENKQAQDLSEQLGNFDIVVGGGVSNLSNTQDFRPYAAQWQAFLQGGGVVVATDASYGGINASWIGAIDPAFSTRSAVCSAHTRPSAETAAVHCAAGDPLLSVPADLQTGLTAKTNWAHLDELGPGWTVAIRCSDNKPVFVHRAVGKGLLVVTSYFRFTGAGAASTGLLQNVITMAKMRQQGLQVLNVAWASPAMGRNRVTMRLRNVSDQPAQVAAVLTQTDGKPWPPVRVEQTLAGETDGELAVDYDIPVRGEHRGVLELLKDGQVLLSIPHDLIDSGVVNDHVHNGSLA